MHSKYLYSSVISTNNDDRKIKSRLDASSKLGNTMILIPNSNYHKKVDSVVVSMSHLVAWVDEEFRVPLHAEAEAVAGFLDPLDHAIGRGGVDDE